MVVQIQESPDAVAHLVSFVKSVSWHQLRVIITDFEVVPSKDGSWTWIMFNDFLVRPVSEDEVLSFPDQWKVPAVIIFERENMEELLNLEVLPKELDREILFKDVSIAW